MTGNEIAKILKNTKGKVSAPMVTPDTTPFIYVEKKDLIRWAENFGDEETKMKLSRENSGSGWYIDVQYD